MSSSEDVLIVLGSCMALVFFARFWYHMGRDVERRSMLRLR